jgi:hypothetical protein
MSCLTGAGAVAPNGLVLTCRRGARLSAVVSQTGFMKTQDKKRDSISGLRLDLITAKALVWVVSVGRNADLTSEAHIYFFDRYQRLAECHRRRGQPRSY